MSGMGDELDPLIQRVLLESDPTNMRAVMDRMVHLFWEAGKAMEDVAKKSAKRQEDLFQAYLRQRERLQEAHIKQMERRDQQRLNRLAARQNAAAAQQLSDQKATDAADLQRQKQADRIKTLNHDNYVKAVRERQRKADWIETHQLEQKFIQETEIVKSGLRKIEMTQRANERSALSAQEAAQQKSINAHKAMWSVVRTVTETGSRFMSSITQSALRSTGNAVGIGLRRITGTYRSEGNRQEAALRSSLATQNAMISRAMVRQQGIYASGSAAAARGATGGFMNLRNFALAGGGYLSARALFGPLQDYEQTQVSFENLLGSAQKAEDMLSDLRQFNVATPFNLPQITQAAKQLLAMGETAREVVPDLQAIGDVGAKFSASSEDVSGVVRALGQMSQSARVSAQDINQIQQRFVGFNARAAIARGLGISVAEAMEQIASGAITGNQGMNAMIEGMKSEERAAGAMEEQMKTLTGAVSNFSDMIQMLWIDTMVPFLPVLSSAVRQTTAFIDSLFHGSGVWAIVRSGLMGIGIALGVLVGRQGFKALIEQMQLLKVIILAHPLTALALALSALGTILYRHNDLFRGFVDGFIGGIRDIAVGPAISALTSMADAFRSVGSAIAKEIAPNLAVLFRWLEKGEWLNALQSLGGIFTEGFDLIAEKVSEFAANAAEFLRPFAGVLVSGVQYAFYTLQVWLNSGGVGQLGDMLADAWGAAVERLGAIDWGRFVKPALIAIGAAAAYAIGGIPLLLVTALVAASPRLRDGIMMTFSNIADWIGREFPGLLYTALHNAAEFLSGPLLATIFGPVGVRIIAGVVGAVALGAVAIATGLIDGLKRSLPSVIDAVQGLLNDIISAVKGGLRDIPIIGELIAAAFVPLEVILRGIIPTLGVVVDLITLIPTPVLAAGAAIYGLVKAWTVLKVTARATGVFSAFTGMLDTLALRTMYAGDAIGRLGTRMTAATAPAIMNGAASRTQIAMGSIGLAAGRAGTAISAVGAALPGIGMAAAIGLPIILGMWQSSQAAAKANREEILRTANAMLDLQTTAREVLTEVIRNSDAAVRALNDVGLSVDDLFTSLTGSATTVGEFFSGFAGVQEAMDGAGISMREFGAAVLEGDQAVSDLDAILGQVWAEIPEALRDSADAMAEQAQQMLTNADITGRLTEAESDRLAVILAMEHPEAALIDLQADITDRMNGTREASERQTEAYRELTEWIDRARGATDLFKQSIDILNGNQLDLSEATLQIEEMFAALTETREGGSTFEAMRGDFIDASQGIVDFADTLLNNKRPITEVVDQFQTLRDSLVDQVEQFGLSEQAASDFLERLGLPPEFIVTPELRTAAIDNKIQILTDRLVAIGEMDLRPRVKMELEQATQRHIDALENILTHEGTVELLVNAEVQFAAAGFTNAEDIAYLLAGIPRAKGGLITRPELALIGEAGPELILPLSDPRRMAELLAQNAAAVGAAMPSTAVASPLTMGAPTVNATGIAEWIEATAAALAPLGERIATSTLPGMRLWAQTIERVLRRILTGFETWGDTMVSLSTQIAMGIVEGLTSGLSEGRREVAQIVRGYSRSVVTALNPLLTGVGETPIQLNFARGGIAEAYHGPQVHVFNEGRRGAGSSHGEAYIPFDPANRPTSRNLASETVRRLGGNVQWFANGGITTQVPAGASVPGVSGDVVGLVTEFARRLSTWSLANGGGYHVGSGYRSMEEQSRLYQRYLAGVPGQAPAAPPGSSMHNFGLASDGNHWRNLNPAAFGLRYPMSYEPWHVEPMEGKGLLGGDSDFPVFQPIPQPPGTGQRGWFSDVASKVMQKVYDKVLAYAGNLSMSPSTPTLGAMGGSPEIMAELQRQASALGWGSGSQWSSLLNLLTRESSFNPNAQNPTSTAYGLFQFLNATWAGTGIAKTSNFVQQIIAGLRYITSRYGDPNGAWSYWQAHRSYSFGGVTDRDQMAYLHRNEVVLPLSNPSRLSDLLRRTGLDQIIAESLGSGVDLNIPDLSATSRNEATSITGGGPLVGVMNVNSNVTDPEVLAEKVVAKINRSARRVRV